MRCTEKKHGFEFQGAPRVWPVSIEDQWSQILAWRPYLAPVAPGRAVYLQMAEALCHLADPIVQERKVSSTVIPSAGWLACKGAIIQGQETPCKIVRGVFNGVMVRDLAYHLDSSHVCTRPSTKA